ncbi:MAG TPA: glycosyltransferase [Verrucomicrobiae bacterium]
MPKGKDNVRVLFCCTGVGILNRGFESFARDAFDGLKKTPGLEIWLIKGKGERTEREIPVWCLPRTGRAARWVGWLFNRSAYAAEQWSSFLPVVRQIRRLRPHVIFYSDANLGFQLFFRRKWIGVSYRLLFSNGGPVGPPFNRTDFVQQVAPLYHAQALEYGEPASKHFMVPYGIKSPEAPVCDPALKHKLRVQLGMPIDRPVVLSVGWISRQHKRMDYLVEEIARLPQPRPFLQMLGAMDESSREIIELADRLLGRGNYTAKSVSYDRVSDFYRAADVFVLASLQEGFGRVYLEALIHGLPVIAHRHPVMEYVLNGVGILGDLSRPGILAQLLSGHLQTQQDLNVARLRWDSVRTRFGWQTLASQYDRMFQDILER